MIRGTLLRGLQQAGRRLWPKDSSPSSASSVLAKELAKKEPMTADTRSATSVTATSPIEGMFPNQLGHSASFLRDCSSRTSNLVINKENLVAPFSLRLPGGDVANQANYHLNTDGSFRSGIAPYASFIMSRDPQETDRANKAVAAAHHANEMSFCKKNAEGLYVDYFAVPIQGPPIILGQDAFDKLTKATAPILNNKRKILQTLYSKGSKTTTEDLAVHLPHASREELARILENALHSVYFEPALVHPKMKDYPFLAVGGFDAAINDPEDPDPIFYEDNLATPSGLSNNIQLIENIRLHDPELFATFAPYLIKDDTFDKLKEAIDSCAESWTGRSDGISVVVGPGPMNGAHPDVARIAEYSGMPLVEVSDLYEGTDGSVYLHTEGDGPDPVVTGIYSRLEESFLVQDSSKGVPIRGPQFEDHLRFGPDLEPHVAYEHEYEVDKHGQLQAVGVVRDKNGKPVLQESFAKMKSDPTWDTQNRGSILDAIINGKVYVNLVGGRTVDDKRLFAVQADSLAKQGFNHVARPPRTLKDHDLPDFLAADADGLAGYVVKAPDKSGGEGIYLMHMLDGAKRLEIQQMVKDAPNDFVVQEFANFTMLMTPEIDESTGQIKLASKASDLRLFAFQDAAGKVFTGPFGGLIRSALSGFGTNTSAGGGYTPYIIKGPEQSIPWSAHQSVLPATKRSPYVAASRIVALGSFVDDLIELIHCVDPENKTNFAPKAPFLNKWGVLEKPHASRVADQMRSLMDLCGPGSSQIMKELRDFDLLVDTAKPLTAEQVKEARQALYVKLVGFLVPLMNDPRRVSLQSDQVIKERLEAFGYESPKRSKPVSTFAERKSSVDVVTIAKGEPAERGQVAQGGVVYTRKIDGEFVASKDPEVQRLLEEAQKFGVRVLRSTLWKDGEPTSFSGTSFFSMDHKGRPEIVWSETLDFAFAGLCHEMSHMRDWLNVRDQMVKDQGVLLTDGPAMQKINLAAFAEQMTLANTVAGEGRAIQAELNAAGHDSILNDGAIPLPSKPTDRGYARRMSYGLVAGWRRHMNAVNMGADNFNAALVQQLVEASLDVVMTTRKEAVSTLKAKIARVESLYQLTDGDYTEFERDLSRARMLLASFEHANPWTMLMSPDDLNQLRMLGLERKMEGQFWQAFAAIYPKYQVAETDKDIFAGHISYWAEKVAESRFNEASQNQLSVRSGESLGIGSQQ